MNKISNIHNKTQSIETEEMPFNSKNILLYENDLRNIFDS